MTRDAELLREQAERHRHVEEVLESIRANESLMAQVQSALEEERQGIPPTPWEEVERERRRRAGR